MKQIINILLALIGIFGTSLYAAAESYEIVIIDGVVYKLYPDTQKATAYNGFGWNTFSVPKDVIVVEKIRGLSSVSFEDSVKNSKYIGKEFVVDTIDMRIDAGINYTLKAAAINNFTIPPSVKVIKNLGNYTSRIDTIHLSSTDQWFFMDHYTYSDRVNSCLSKLCVNGKYIDNIITPPGMTKIKPNTIVGLDAETMTISEGIEKLDPYTVLTSRIDSISLPESLNEICGNAFATAELKAISIRSKKLKFTRPFDRAHWQLPEYPRIYVDDIAKWCSVGDYEVNIYEREEPKFKDMIVYPKTDNGILNIPEGVTKIRTGGLWVNSKYVRGIVLPSTIEEIKGLAFGTIPQSKLHIKSPIPPKLEVGIDSLPKTVENWKDIYGNTKAYVPVGSGEAYRKAEGWKDFEEIIEGEPDWGVAMADMNEDDIDYIITANNFTYGSQVKLFEIFDAAGSLIVSRKPTCEGKYSLADLPNGVYMLRINGTISRKIIK